MKLLRELSEQVDYIKEEKDGKTNLFLRGCFMQAECTNKNKRSYPLEILERETNRYIEEHLPDRGYGELGHPSGPNINLERVCILTQELKREDNNFIGKAKVTSKGMGLICSGLIEDGARLGVSSRALGSVKPNKAGVNEVQDDLRLLAIDVVADPSAPDAYVAGVFEGREYIWEASSGTWAEIEADYFKKQLISKSAKEINELKGASFQRFLDNITMLVK